MDVPTPDVFLPTYRQMSGGPLASISGRLVYDDGCLWVESAGGRHLMLWPAGTTLLVDGAMWTVSNGNSEAVVGTHVSAAGGEYEDYHYGFVVELIGQEVPERCQAAGRYWLGRDVRTVQP